MERKIYIERYILDISLAHKAELKRMLIGYPVKTSIKGERHQPVKLSNKSKKYLMFNSLGGKYLTSSSLGIRPLY